MKSNILKRQGLILLTIALTAKSIFAQQPVASLAAAIKPANKNGGFLMDGFMLWCPSIIKVDKTYHMFASRWPAMYGLAGWQKHSEIVRATSKKLLGPYKFAEVVITKREGYWDNDRAHNPKIVKCGKTYVLYYISSANETGYAWSQSITGPWQRCEAVAIPFSNPAPLVRPDGSVYVFGRKVVNNSRLAFAYTAPAFNQNYQLATDLANLLPGQNQLEDPTIWYINKQYHVLLSDFHADATGIGKAGAHYFSTDGINYQLVSKEPVYTKEVKYDDGYSQTFRRRERPFIYTNEKGVALALFTACLTIDATGKEHSYIVANGVRNYKP